MKCPKCGTEMITTDEEEDGYKFKMHYCPNCMELEFTEGKNNG